MGRSAEQAASRYRSVRDRSSDSNIQASKAGRDISPCPGIVDVKRRERALEDLEYFLRTYFPGTFRHEWSRDHIHVIDRLQGVVDAGGRCVGDASRER